MNIRSVSNPAQVLAKDKVEENRAIKSDQTEDREANGQQPFPDGEPHRPLTEEEADQVIEKIKGHEGIIKSGLQVVLAVENGQKIVRIETPDGKLVKRLVERELFFYLYQDQKDGMHLVNKTA